GRCGSRSRVPTPPPPATIRPGATSGPTAPVTWCPSPSPAWWWRRPSPTSAEVYAGHMPAENIRVRSALSALPAYVAGKPAADDGAPRYKASSNESPFPPVDAVREAVIASLEVSHRYPDMAAHELRAALGAMHRVDPAQIALSTGSVAVTGDLVRALVDQ